jgi:hypothetical protein
MQFFGLFGAFFTQHGGEGAGLEKSAHPPEKGSECQITRIAPARFEEFDTDLRARNESIIQYLFLEWKHVAVSGMRAVCQRDVGQGCQEVG